MADSVYISKNMTPEQQKFLRLLHENDIAYFNKENIQQLLGENFTDLQEILENLSRKKFIERIRKGHYVVKGFRDPYVLGTFLAGEPSAVGYWSALHVHGLTPRFPNKIFIQTVKRKRPAEFEGNRWQFVTVTPEKFTGITYHGYGLHRFPVTDPEKTFIDLFDLYRYSGGLEIMVPALAQATLDPQKLITYAKAVGNVSAMKRLGYLSDILEKKELMPFIEFVKTHTNQRYTLLDPAGPDTGPFDKEWRLRLNISPENLQRMATEIY